MTTTTTTPAAATTAPPAIVAPRTIATIAAEFIASGCPTAQAWSSAKTQFESEMAQHHAAELEKSRKAGGPKDTVNVLGLPVKAQKTAKGEIHYADEPMAVLTEGGSNANSQFGPAVVLYLRQYVSGSSAKPVEDRYSSGSNLSVHESAETLNPCIQQAAILAASSVRLFARIVKDYEDGTQGFETVEYSDRRNEWLELVTEEVTAFYDDLHEAASKKGKRRR